MQSQALVQLIIIKLRLVQELTNVFPGCIKIVKVVPSQGSKKFLRN